MTRFIHKYPIFLGSKTQTWIGPTDKVLTAQMQSGQICVWVEHSSGSKLGSFTHYLFVVGTGATFETKGEYVATVQDGVYVWHVYMEPREKADG